MIIWCVCNVAVWKSFLTRKSKKGKTKLSASEVSNYASTRSIFMLSAQMLIARIAKRWHELALPSGMVIMLAASELFTR